jgi:hypothetical protein
VEFRIIKPRIWALFLAFWLSSQPVYLYVAFCCWHLPQDISHKYLQDNEPLTIMVNMKKKQTFTAVIQNAGRGGAFVEVPFDVEKEFGSKRPKIKALIEGIPYRGILTRMGTECHILGIRKEIRAQAGKMFGDEVTLTVEPDIEPRVIEVPADLLKELKKDRKAKAFFDKLSYTHQKEYVSWITEAKKEETRHNRIVKSIELLKKGKKTI